MGLLARLNTTERTIPESLRHPTLIKIMSGKIGPLFPRDEKIPRGMRGEVRTPTHSPMREPHKTKKKWFDYREHRRVRNKIAAASRKRNER